MVPVSPRDLQALPDADARRRHRRIPMPAPRAPRARIQYRRLNLVPDAIVCG